MKLAIDGYEANASERVGVGRYAFEIIAAMAKHPKDFFSVDVYLPQPPKPHMPKATDAWKYHVAVPKPFWTFIGLPLALSIAKPDVVFSPTHYIPRWVNIPKVCAIMDISYLHYPEQFLPQDLHKLIHWTAYSVRHSAKIITISEFSKRAIIEAYQVDPDRVVVVYPGLTMGKAKKPTAKKRYILSVGTLQPRKNFVRLIEAFSRLPDKDIELVIVGKKGWLYEEILEAPQKFGVGGRIRFLDFVSDEALAGLYQHATCFVLPSLYEGFGLPVLEAMAHGVPVVVSNTSSLPEIAGEAGIYVDRRYNKYHKGNDTRADRK